MRKLNEECGVFGILTPTVSDVGRSTYYGLFALQHRGQESCGIAVNDDGVFHSYKDAGLVNDVFTPEILESLGQGQMAVGHVRYGTSAAKGRTNAQPTLVNHVKGRMAIAFNGCLTNSAALREELELGGAIFHTTGDAELIAYLITRARLTTDSIEDAVSVAMDQLDGAYSLVLMSPSKLIAARDENGIHPLCFGTTADGGYVIASESCALDSVSAVTEREVRPGEILVFDRNGVRSLTTHCGRRKQATCIFEYIYFARPDSIIEGCAVHTAHLRAGELLAKENPVEADVVIGVPDSGIDAAIGYARASGIPYGIGFIKNKYIGRTFIAPGQAAREDLVKIKLNPVEVTVRGKRVVVVDDSIVRGTTSARIVQLLRQAGATEVHMRLSSPPFIHDCYYGTDIESEDMLIARRHTMEEIAEIIGVDSLGFLRVEDLPRLIEGGTCTGYCDGCFSGHYPTEVPKEKYVNRYDRKISERRDEGEDDTK